eukprot:gb/GFBE01061419.1/.p1 GENE.gb/GFBE01061419.1/~~gb/GFBE01061419.1/.p1  ORF type:complete len:123 (+),score=8.16 gb/GFBE01061419.1/:1-369(+)
MPTSPATTGDWALPVALPAGSQFRRFCGRPCLCHNLIQDHMFVSLPPEDGQGPPDCAVLPVANLVALPVSDQAWVTSWEAAFLNLVRTQQESLSALPHAVIDDVQLERSRASQRARAPAALG